MSEMSGSGPPTGERVVTRRGMLGISAGAALAGAVAGAGVAQATGGAAGATATAPADRSVRLREPTVAVPFRGAHQAGITTPAQDRMHFAALDVVTDDPLRLRALLTTWTTAAQRMTLGVETEPGGVVGGGALRVPLDTGEAYDLDPAQLTITIGFGPSLFDDRFGLAERRPTGLSQLPAFPGDRLQPARVGGDIGIQACSNDPQVAVHAIRNLIRLGTGVVSARWSQLGFGRTSSTTRTQVTPRNLFGFKDGTANIKATDTATLDRHVWVQPADEVGGGDWLVGGTYLVARRIAMHLERWDRTTLGEQEETFGRAKDTGAPLGHEGEFDTIDLSLKEDDGSLAIPATSHVRLAHKSQRGGIEILRRGYNYTDGTDAAGHFDAGLFFIAFMRDAHRQFVPLQQALATNDALNEYITHTGSAVFACPPGLSDTQDWGQLLFD